MTSRFIRHIACEHCGSTDGNSLYDDGHTHCFVCHTTEHDGEYVTKVKRVTLPMLEIKGTVKSIPDRGISQATCEKYGVTTDGQQQYYP
jgi:twinkle protein